MAFEAGIALFYSIVLFLMIFPRNFMQIDTRTEVWMDDGEPDTDFEIREANVAQEQGLVRSMILVFIHLIFAWQMTFSVSDRCVDSLLNIVRYFFTMMQFVFGINGFCEIVDAIPGTIYKARKFIGLEQDEFIKFIVCSKCHKLYTYEQACETVNGIKCSKKCGFVRYPNHPQGRMRELCGTPLMKVVVSADGKRKSLYPFKTYCYQSIKVALQRLLQRKEIVDALRQPKVQSDDGFFDIYDGKIWRSLKDHNGRPYFTDKRNLAAIFNIDWFQPFDSSEHSVGAMYMAILNLPRGLRFKKENILLVGVIPGPKEPDLTVNEYLKPLVNELLLFWKGEYLDELGEKVLYRFALICVASDLPATRKCCGFLSYNALQGKSI